MQRRHFLKLASSLSTLALAPAGVALAYAASAPPRPRRLLVVVELKGGNDGLNTVVPYRDETYYTLRPKLGIPRAAVIPLSDRAGLHPALAHLLPMWRAAELAILLGVGYADANLSHFRSIEIWDTASRSNEYLQDGWLARALAAVPADPALAADGIVIGSPEPGPLGGNARTRVIALASTDQFLRQARLAGPAGDAHNKALAHIMKVEADIAQAAARLAGAREFATTFPAGGFGNAIRTAAQIAANPSGVAVIRVSLSGFDTHGGQLATHARLLGELADGLVALKSALVEIDRWNDTLVLTYAEFGRRPRENLSAGTDHGTSSAHFVLGGRIAGGLYGEAPALDRLRGDGNPGYAIDFRDIYATVLEQFWNVRASSILGGRRSPVPLLRA